MNEVEESLKAYEKNVIHLLNYNSTQANVLHQYYKDLMREGFTENQAFELIKFRGINV